MTFLSNPLIISNILSSDVCQLPKVVGRCRAAKRRVYFDSRSGTCKSFIYGGCDGNLNNFQDMESCELKCGKSTGGSTPDEREVDVCRQPPKKVGLFSKKILFVRSISVQEVRTKLIFKY